MGLTNINRVDSREENEKYLQRRPFVDSIQA